MQEKKPYSQKLLDPKWQKLRLLTLDRDKFTCQLCQDDQSSLSVHHLRYAKSGDPWDTPMDQLVTVCQDCHQVVSFLEKSEPLFDFSLIQILKVKPPLEKCRLFFVTYFSNYYVLVMNNNQIIDYHFSLTSNQMLDIIRINTPLWDALKRSQDDGR